MAIQLDLEYRGLSAPSTYVMVAPGSLTLFKEQMSFQVLYLAARGIGSYKVEGHTCEYSLSGPNPFEQAYAYLKTLPEFENCTDC